MSKLCKWFGINIIINNSILLSFSIIFYQKIYHFFCAWSIFFIFWINISFYRNENKDLFPSCLFFTILSISISYKVYLTIYLTSSEKISLVESLNVFGLFLYELSSYFLLVNIYVGKAYVMNEFFYCDVILIVFLLVDFILLFCGSWIF